VNGILLVSSFCEVCSAVSNWNSWARCLPVCSRGLRLTKHNLAVASPKIIEVMVFLEI